MRTKWVEVVELTVFEKIELLVVLVRVVEQRVEVLTFSVVVVGMSVERMIAARAVT